MTARTTLRVVACLLVASGALPGPADASAAAAVPGEVPRSVLLDYDQMSALTGAGPSLLHRGYGSIDGGVAWSWAIGTYGDPGLRHVVVAVAEQSCGSRCSWAARVAAVPREYPRAVSRGSSRVVAWKESLYGTTVLEMRRAGRLVVAVTVAFPPGFSTRAEALTLAGRVAAAQAARV